jgi:hypothetical protein
MGIWPWNIICQRLKRIANAMALCSCRHYLRELKMKQLLLGVIAASLTTMAVAKLYKWTDENGKVQYSDKPPPQLTTSGTAELNQSGRIVRKTEGLLTPEQKAEREAAEVQKKAEAQKAAEAKRRDKALMDSFNNVNEIDVMLARNLEQVLASIQSDQQRIQATNKRLSAFEIQNQAMKAAGKPIPEDLKADITNTRAELGRLDNNIKQKQEIQQQLRNKADADKTRLIELKGASAK